MKQTGKEPVIGQASSLSVQRAQYQFYDLQLGYDLQSILSQQLPLKIPTTIVSTKYPLKPGFIFYRG
jgi:hypothetical protein